MPLHTHHRETELQKRRNRSILNITRCLLLDKGLPGYLWGEVVKAAGDLLNLHSTKRHPDKTPEELFSGKKPSISHLKFFGSPAYVRTTNPSQSKLNPRSEKCVLLSSDYGAKAYRCYRPSTKKIFISRDVLVDEVSSESLPSSDREDILPDTTPAPTCQEERMALLDSDTPTQILDPTPHATDPPSPPTMPPSSPTLSVPASSQQSPLPSRQALLPSRHQTLLGVLMAFAGSLSIYMILLLTCSFRIFPIFPRTLPNS